MNEFITHIDKLKGMVTKLDAVAKGTGVDTVDLTALKSTADAIANTCFAGGSMSPAQMIARKDAYDFIVSLSRLADVVGLSRADYYAESAAVTPVVQERIDYVKATTLLMSNAGPK